MKNLIFPCLLICAGTVHAQVGVGTTTPLSTLDVRGSVSLNYRNITGNYTATANDYTLIFTGVAAATITLPNATTCTGRVYKIKNSSATLPTPLLTIATTAAQTIDGSTTWPLDISKDIIEVTSNGTNWEISGGSSSSNKDDLANGSLYVSTSANTTFGAVNTPAKVLGTTSALNLYRTTAAGNNRIVYTGSKTRIFQVLASITATQASSNITYTFIIYKNGAALPDSRQLVRLNNSTDKGSISISCLVSLATNDYVEVWAENNTNTVTLVVTNMNLLIK